MSIRDFAWDAGALAVALAVGAGLGFVQGDRIGTADMLTKVTDARHAEELAKAQARSSAAALSDINQRLQAQKTEAEHLRHIAEAALDQRDTARTTIAKLTKQRIAAVEKLAHENVDCSALRHMPVCPAIGQRLFHPSGATHASAHGGGGAGGGVSRDSAPAHRPDR